MYQFILLVSGDYKTENPDSTSVLEIVIVAVKRLCHVCGNVSVTACKQNMDNITG